MNVSRGLGLRFSKALFTPIARVESFEIVRNNACSECGKQTQRQDLSGKVVD
jgi:hypothetical protein